MRRRAGFGTGTLALGLVVMLSGQVAAAVSWSAAKTVSAQHGFNTGVALATTKSGSKTYLHQVYVNQYPGGHHANDASHGPREAIMYQRRTASGAASGGLVRLNGTKQHGFESAVAASGSHVYVVWVHLGSYDYTSSTLRTIEFRANAHNGSGAWGAVKNLTTTEQVDAPAIAAAGSYVYVSWVNSVTGAINLQVSSDYGAHFNDSGLSFPPTNLNEPITGYYGDTALAASGALVGMAWLSGAGNAAAWTSNDHATSKSDFSLTSGDETGPPGVAADATRLAFAIPAGGKIKVRVWDGLSVGPERDAATFPSAAYKGSYSVAVALSGSHGVGVAYSACRLASCYSTETPAKGVDIVWGESADNGVHWKKPANLGLSTVTSAIGKQHRLNAYASAVIVGSKRYVIWDAFAGNYSTGTQQLRIGSGTP